MLNPKDEKKGTNKIDIKKWIHRVNIKEILFYVVILVFVFNEILSKTVCNFFSYIDECIILLMVLLSINKIIFKRKEIHISKWEKYILIIYIAIYTIGLLGNIVYGFQENIFAILIDMLSWCKFFLAYICADILLEKETIETYYKYAINISKFIIILALILEILNLTIGIGIGEGYIKYGIKSLAFWGHPSFTSAIFACITSLLLFEDKKNNIWIILGLILSFLTLRMKAWGFVALVIFAKLFLQKNISIKKVIIIILAIVAIAWNQITFYFLDTNASRSRAMQVAVNMANDLFPLGGGFASFGTVMSGKCYSEAYEKYGISNRWGFRRDNYAYIADGGLSTIIGQFGWIGSILFVLMMYNLIVSIKEDVKNTNSFVPYIASIGYIIISSTNEAAFNTGYTVLLSIVLNMTVKKDMYVLKTKK